VICRVEGCGRNTYSAITLCVLHLWMDEPRGRYTPGVVTVFVLPDKYIAVSLTYSKARCKCYKVYGRVMKRNTPCLTYSTMPLWEKSGYSVISYENGLVVEATPRRKWVKSDPTT